VSRQEAQITSLRADNARLAESVNKCFGAVDAAIKALQGARK
jgi:hypothetical protein